MPEHDNAAWRDVLLELLGAWPERMDEMTATAYVRSLQGRGVTDPHAALNALRVLGGDHPPPAPVLAAAVFRDGQPDAPSFDAVVEFVARTIATRTKAGDDALSGYVEFVAAELHEAPARWVAGIGIPALREVPDPRYLLDQGQRIRLRDHAQGYAGDVAAWRVDPRRGVAVRAALERDRIAGRDVQSLDDLRPVREIGPGA